MNSGKKQKKVDKARVSKGYDQTLKSNVDETKEKLQSTIYTIVDKAKSLINVKKAKKANEVLDE